MLKTLIFDWHGVLDKTTFESLVHTLAQLSNQTIPKVKQKISFLERAYAQGTLPVDQFWHDLQNVLALSQSDLNIAKKSILVVELNTPLWRVLPDLSNKYTLAVLSDCPQDKISVIRQHCDLSLFALTHFSAEKRLLKSADNFFLNIVEELDEKVENCLYIDDSEKHIQTAQRLGFKTCLFTDYADLKPLVMTDTFT